MPKDCDSCETREICGPGEVCPHLDPEPEEDGMKRYATHLAAHYPAHLEDPAREGLTICGLEIAPADGRSRMIALEDYDQRRDCRSCTCWKEPRVAR